MSVTSDPTKITFGESNDSMSIVHTFLKKNGIVNVDWDDKKFDEPTALGLLTLNTTLKCVEFANDGGFNSDAKRYKEGSKVVIGAGANYYSSSNAEKSSGVIRFPTTGTLIRNGLLTNDNSLNPLMVSLMRSPIEISLANDVKLTNLTGNKDSKDTLAKTTSDKTKDSKNIGGYSQGEIVYLRPDFVIPSFSDIVIGSELTKIMKVGQIAAKGIELINDINTNNKDAKQFLDNASKDLDDFLNRVQGRFEDKTKKAKDIERRKEELRNSSKNKAPAFNKNGMFIKNLITDTIIYIPFRPDSVDESYSVSWNSQSTRGSAHESYGYEMTTGSSPSISFDFDVGALTYYMTMNKDTTNFGDTQVYEDLIRKSKLNPPQQFTADFTYEKIFDIVTSYLNALKALAYPLYTNGIVTPPSCYVSIARTFRFVGVCTAVNISHKGPLYIKPGFDTKTGDFINNQKTSGDQMFMNYSVTLNFNKIVNQDFSADTVEVYGDNWTGGMADTAEYTEVYDI